MGFPAHSLSPSEQAALLAAERQGDPFLAYRDVHGDLRIVPLSVEDSVRIGRTADNDVVLAGDTEVSRAHAQLMAAGAGWTLVDDGMSRNGTYVNGERVLRHRRLEDRDMVRVGQTSILFRHPSAVGDDSTAVARTQPELRLTDAERRVLVALCRPLLEPGLVSTPASNQEIADAAHAVPARRQEPHPRPVRQARRRRPAPEPQARGAGAARARARPRLGAGPVTLGEGARRSGRTASAACSAAAAWPSSTRRPTSRSAAPSPSS